MKALRFLAIIVTGAVFMFSGFVKGVDPLGSAYKFHDYLNAFGFGFLNFLSLPLSVLLSTTEFFAGFSVISGIMRKQGVFLVTILMAIFTPITLVLALTNPVTDCGCFGDAIKLTNWQTFIKNIILLIPVLFLLITERHHSVPASPKWPRRVKALPWVFGGAVIVLFIGFCIFNIVFLPVIDFLPYKKGTRIADKMTIPENASPDVYRTTFIYEKNGTRKEFDLTNYPADDTTWKFIDQKSVLIQKGHVPEIHDFVITDSSGNDITGRILDNKGYTFLMISRKLQEAEGEHLEDGFETGKHLMNQGVDFYVITASGRDDVRNYSTEINICTCDETTLKTIVRANPGYLLLENGVIRGKWSWANLPSKTALSDF